METIEKIVRFFAEEWTVLSSIPATFIIAVSFIGLIIWFAARAHYRAQIEGLKSSNDALKDHRNLYQDKLDDAEAAKTKLESDLKVLRAGLASLPEGEIKREISEASVSASTSLASLEEALLELHKEWKPYEDR